MNRRLITIAVALAIVVATLGAGTVFAIRAAGCGPASAPAWTSDYDPSAKQFGGASEKVANLDWTALAMPVAAAAAAAFPLVTPPSLGGGVRFQMTGEPAAVAFLPVAEPTATFTATDLIAAGGLVIKEQPTAGLSAQTVFDAVGARAADVRVGIYDGAMVHGDPDASSGIRPYGLYFSDGSRFMSIKGLNPTLVIDTARSMYC